MVLEIEAFEGCLQSYMHDYLTGLHSRGFLDTILDRELARCKRHDNELSLLFLDIDDFKKVNDLYGHVAGDRCLAKVAHIIKDSIRTEDTAVRYGGEEIVVIFPQTSKVDALAIGERIRTQISMTAFGNQTHPYQVTVSGGLVAFPMDGRDCAQLLERADAAMYQAKGAGKNTIVVYSHEKRRCLRVDFDRHVEAKPVEFLNKPVSMDVQGKNISSGGMLFEAASSFSIGSKVQLRMLLVPPGDHIEVTGVVVRNKLNRRGRFETGISFLDIDKPVQKAIHDYLRIG
jgi:diguanylate cyclase (GGDEF)-like protein